LTVEAVSDAIARLSIHVDGDDSAHTVRDSRPPTRAIPTR
jgi:hypothetical protein